MKNFVFAFFFFWSALLQAQTIDSTTVVFTTDTSTVSYRLDTNYVGSTFYLVETRSVESTLGTRPTVMYNPIFFSDTAGLSSMVSTLYLENEALLENLRILRAQQAEASYKYERIKYLRDSVFQGYTGGGPRMVAMPPPGAETQAAAQGSGGVTWAVLNAKPEQISIIKGEPGLLTGVYLESDYILLKPDGKLVQFKKPKQKKPK